MNVYILDACALIALLQDEQGADNKKEVALYSYSVRIAVKAESFVARRAGK